MKWRYVILFMAGLGLSFYGFLYWPLAGEPPPLRAEAAAGNGSSTRPALPGGRRPPEFPGAGLVFDRASMSCPWRSRIAPPPPAAQRSESAC